MRCIFYICGDASGLTRRYRRTGAQAHRRTGAPPPLHTGVASVWRRWAVRMALDIVAQCADAARSAAPQATFLTFAAVFAAYIGLDALVASVSLYLAYKQRPKDE